MEEIWLKLRDQGSAFADISNGITLAGKQVKLIAQTRQVARALQAGALVHATPDEITAAKAGLPPVEVEAPVDTPSGEAAEASEVVAETPDYTTLGVDALRAECDRLGLAYTPQAKRADLLALLTETAA
ncbi:hypothetical protein UFOVP1492_124 [uncultured Caudovirales phage]|uniref:Rho termination factor, N-terminal n=1 Tax=uncultured Caudovirales phage TaxID=2100421 RepID=A0A6J5SS32_9CAUD|nr:hypothetical protein UFOVP1127_10 [uncultured Caudovirales phage]CAB4193350.1 hypothetical protein UFOVP1242_64 [uncultured Caudovirales phage]CAB4217906.1 hypothetical protein UFOVP1492_124 [uncultured Caudovirales phage]CAB5231072.1 hypothetical protein UFOVP1580_17 [uncultured Caudovirales phage]